MMEPYEVLSFSVVSDFAHVSLEGKAIEPFSVLVHPSWCVLFRHAIERHVPIWIAERNGILAMVGVGDGGEAN